MKKYQHQIIEEELIRSKENLKPYWYGHETQEIINKRNRIRQLEIHLEIAKKSFDEGKQYTKVKLKTLGKKEQ